MKGSDARTTCGSGSVGAVRSKVRLAASHKHLKGKPWCKVLAGAGPECGTAAIFHLVCDFWLRYHTVSAGL